MEGAPAWLRPRPVRLRQLPPPDTEQIDMHETQVCLVTGPCDPLAVRLADRLHDLGITPVLLEIVWSGDGPDVGRLENRDAEKGIALEKLQRFPRYSVRADEDPQQVIQRVRKLHGAIRGLVYLQPGSPLLQGRPSPIRSDAPYLFRVPFLLAKAVRPFLMEAGESGLGKLWFMTVTRQDGLLGMSGGDDCDPVLGGMGGITKSLRAEWSDVFCRSVDLAIEMDADQASAAVVAELLDPNRMIVEVGHGPQGRVTLEAVGEALWPTI